MHALLLIFVALVAVQFAQSLESGSYTLAGLGARKKELTANGANTLDMAIAMLESDHMKADYKYGDGKTGGAANFGIFKMNWGMIKEVDPQFKGVTDYNKGAVLNTNLKLDIETLHRAQTHYGLDLFFAGHRNGGTGLKNPHTADINNYKNAVLWIRDQIDSNAAHKTDDIRFWVKVPGIY